MRILLKDNLAEPGKWKMHMACEQVIPFLAMDSSQWFSARDSFAPGRHVAMSGDIIGCQN